MRKFFIVITLLFLITSITAHAQWRSDTHDVYNALKIPADITIDGELDDDEGWEDVIESVTGTNGEPFCGVEFDAGGKEEVWEANGGTWDGPEDHETCFAIVWDEDAIYLAISVTDDDHQNSGGAWNGDSVQLGFEMSGKRDGGLALLLYNVALDNDAKNLIYHDERPGGTGLNDSEYVAVVRNENENETYYEYKFTADEINKGDNFEEGFEFGLAICVNDGDDNAPGQKGWSGWYTDCIVKGPKQSEHTGLVRLSADELAVDVRNKLTTTWGRVKASK